MLGFKHAKVAQLDSTIFDQRFDDQIQGSLNGSQGILKRYSQLIGDFGSDFFFRHGINFQNEPRSSKELRQNNIYKEPGT